MMLIMPKIIAGGMQLSEYEMQRLRELDGKHKFHNKIEGRKRGVAITQG